MRFRALVFLASLATGAASAFPVCELDGKHINMNDGSQIEGKTGTVKCIDSDSKELQSETQYRNGKIHGKELLRSWEAGKNETHYVDGVQHGPKKTFEKDGKLSREEIYVQGKRVGPQKSFHPDGKLHTLSFDDETEALATLSKSGAPEWVKCDKRLLPYLPEVKKWCGLGGKPGIMKLFDWNGTLRETRTYLNGKRQGEQKEFFENGKPKAVYSMKDDKSEGVQKEYNEKGSLLRELIWLAGQTKGERTYYLNGKPKMERMVSPDRKTLLVREFYDDGRVKVSGSYRSAAGNDAEEILQADLFRLRQEGLFSHYTESGALYLEETFVDGKLQKSKGFHKNGKVGLEETFQENRLATRRCYDPTGKLTGSEKFFEDGSREPGSTPCPRDDGEKTPAPVKDI